LELFEGMHQELGAVQPIGWLTTRVACK
jgi:hypothetical protein